MGIMASTNLSSETYMANTDIYSKFKYYIIDWDKVNTLQDIIEIFKAVQVSFYCLPDDTRFPFQFFKEGKHEEYYKEPEVNGLPELTLDIKTQELKVVDEEEKDTKAN